MEKAQVVERQEQFQEQFAALDGELRALRASQPAGDQLDTPVTKRVAARRGLELQCELGTLCAKHGECQLAVLCFHRLVDELEQLASTKTGATDEEDEEEGDQEYQSELVALRINVLNCLAALQFKQSNQTEAMSLLLEAKHLHREASTMIKNHVTGMSTLDAMDKMLAVNYALFFHAKGSVQDAILVARGVVEDSTTSLSASKIQADGVQLQVAGTDTDAAAKSTAYMLLSQCSRDEDEHGSKALALAELSVESAGRTTSAELQCRAYSNLGLMYFERGEVAAAVPQFLAAFRSALQVGDLQLQAVTKYHLGVAIAHTDTQNVALAHPEGESKASTKPETSTTESSADLPGSGPVDSSEKHLPPKDWFLQSESLAGSLAKPDDRLSLLAQGCRGQEEYFGGEFHTAEAEFTIALQRLKQLLGQSSVSTVDTDSSSDEYAATEPMDGLAARELDPELAKLHGFLLSYLGCTFLVEGRFELAERSHESDLALALEREDVYAQQRALRNLALVFNCTQRYEKAVPMWRDALEIAAVLQSKTDQMMALSGLGTALKEARILHRVSAVPIDGESEGESSLLAPPLPIFLRLRALAVEVGDRHQQILAQRHIVSVYESHADSDYLKPEAGTGESGVEKRLAECDVLVRLCEQYENLQYRADAYRSLANALTAQLARLRSRGAARFAEAISVLSLKRDSVCGKYQEATEALAFRSEADTVPLEAKERQYRAPVTRVDVFSRR